MTTIAATASDLSQPRSRERAASPLAIEIVSDLQAAEKSWRELERDGLMSPYGRFDWIAAYTGHAADETVRIALARDAAGRPALLLPLSVGRRFGQTVASSVGGKHANFVLPLMRPDAPALIGAAGGGTRLLAEIGRALRADVVSLGSVPVTWSGLPNPFAAGGRPSASDAWSLRLEADGAATLERSMSAEARKKLRNKSRGLAKLGPVELAAASTEAEVDLILQAFFRQKEERFGELGIADPFADPATRAFLREGALRGIETGNPAIELYGLTVAGRPVAILGGAGDRDRLSGMFLSFEQGEGARYSPGDILVTGVIGMQCARGRSFFDLGVGDARYKRSICDTREPLVDVLVPVTGRGRAYAAARGAFIEAKRRVKASDRAMRLIGALRRGTARLRG